MPKERRAGVGFATADATALADGRRAGVGGGATHAELLSDLTSCQPSGPFEAAEWPDLVGVASENAWLGDSGLRRLVDQVCA